MKVLIITYYWPPAGGSGVQRWLKFTKYLQNFGIEPIIYTVDNANYPKEDHSLTSEIPDNITVLKQPIWEPTNLFFWKKKNKQKKEISNATNSTLLSFIRGNFLVPDPKVFWVKKSAIFLNTYLKNNKVDVVISTGPPHSMHLIAQKIKQQHTVKWIADFRDPWSNLYYNKEFNQLAFAKKKNRKLENSVLKSADCVLTVSNSLKKEFSKISKNVKVITNGFDDEVLVDQKIILDAEFTISYIGLLPKQSNPKVLFEILQDICEENTDFKKDLKLNFIGDISDEVNKNIEIHGLQKNTNFIGYVSHQKAISYQKKSQVLLLLIPNVPKSEGILTGKLFEYLTTKRPILAIGPENGDLAEILRNTNSGVVIGFDQKENLKNEILSLYQKYKSGSLKMDVKHINQFHRKALTKELSEIIKGL